MKSLALIFLSLLLAAGALANGLCELDDASRRKLESGEILTWHYKESGNRWMTWHACTRFQAEPDEILTVLLDYDDFADLSPVVDEVEIIERGDDTAVLGYRLKNVAGRVPQYRVRMSLVENSVTKRINWEKVEWDAPEQTIVSTDGYWKVEPYPGPEGGSLVTYHVYSDPGPLPFGIRWIVNWMSGRNVAPTLESVRARVLEDRAQVARQMSILPEVSAGPPELPDWASAEAAEFPQ